MTNTETDDDKTEREACLACLREYAKTVPELRRAAEEGYPIAEAAVTHLEGRITNALAEATPDEITVLTEGTWEWMQVRWTERAAPRPEAFAVRDAIVQILDRLYPRVSEEECLYVGTVEYAAPGVDVIVHPVRRMEYARKPLDGREGRRTTVPIQIQPTAPGVVRMRLIVCPAESRVNVPAETGRTEGEGGE